jgi:hypothetical protein
LTSTALCQDKPMMLMSKEAMMAKQKMMEPAMMKATEMSMMGEKTMMPMMVAKEMVHQEMMQDSNIMGTVKKNAMMKESEDEMMMNDKNVQMVGEKLVADTSEIQMLFQQLVARHIAANKMAMMMKTDQKMESMAGTVMKKMAMNNDMMMSAKKKMMSSQESTMMMAREQLISSLMMDKEVMALVEKEAMKQMDSKMAPMMADDKVKMAGEMIMKDKAAMDGMIHESMTRQMVKEKNKMMMKDMKK